MIAGQVLLCLVDAATLLLIWQLLPAMPMFQTRFLM
jgi:hypothetical protein